MLIAGFHQAEALQADFIVSPKGDDRWSGRLAHPNKNGTDGPFATLDKARQAVRAIPDSSRDQVVLVRGAPISSLSRWYSAQRTPGPGAMPWSIWPIREKSRSYRAANP